MRQVVEGLQQVAAGFRRQDLPSGLARQARDATRLRIDGHAHEFIAEGEAGHLDARQHRCCRRRSDNVKHLEPEGRHGARQKAHGEIGRRSEGYDLRGHRLRVRTRHRDVACRCCQLQSHLDHIRPRPRQRIRHHHGYTRAARVGVRGDRAECVIQVLGGHAPHFGVVAARVGIHRCDRRTRHDVVELVEQHLAPRVVQVLLRIRLAPERRDRAELLGVEQQLFVAAIVALRRGLAGVDAAVILEVKLAVPRGDLHLRRFALQVVEERLRVIGEQPRIDGVISLPALRGLQHAARRPAAVVAHAVEVHDLVRPHLRCVLGDVSLHPYRLDRIAVVMREESEHAAAIGRLPPEQFVRELRHFVPVDLLGDEVLHAALPVDLRQLPVVAERIGIPAGLDLHAELVAEVTRADQ